LLGLIGHSTGVQRWRIGRIVPVDPRQQGGLRVLAAGRGFDAQWALHRNGRRDRRYVRADDPLSRRSNQERQRRQDAKTARPHRRA
jgi:hypothetical protein